MSTTLPSPSERRPSAHNADQGIRLNRLVAWGLLALVGLSAMPNGSSAPWAWSCAAAAASFLLVATMFRPMSRPLQLRPILPAVIFTGLVLLWIVVQITAPPFPGFIKTLWNETEATLTTRVHSTISIDAASGLDGLIRLMTYCTVFAVAFCLAHSHRIAASLLRGIVAVAGLVVVSGAIFESAGIGYISKHGVSGFLPDRNVFATYAGLGLMASVALLARPKLRSHDLTGSRTSRLRAILSFYVARAWPSLIAIAIMLIGIARSESRAGLAATAIGLLTLIISIRMGSRDDRSSRMGLKISTLIAIVILTLTVGGTVNRLPLSGNAASERAEIYRSVYDGIQMAPLTGFGYGTFSQGFEFVRSDALPRSFSHAHNLFLENMFELGIPFGILIFGAVLWLSIPMIRRLRQRTQDGTMAALGLSSIVLTAVHSMLDATLRVPALAILFAAILGLSAGSCVVSNRKNRNR